MPNLHPEGPDRQYQPLGAKVQAVEAIEATVNPDSYLIGHRADKIDNPPHVISTVQTVHDERAEAVINFAIESKGKLDGGICNMGISIFFVYLGLSKTRCHTFASQDMLRQRWIPFRVPK